MKRATQTFHTAEDAKQLLRDAHDANFAYSGITLDLVVEALRHLADSGEVHEFWGKALEVAAEHEYVTRVLNIEFGAEPRTGRRAHVDVYHVSMGDGRIYQMGHVSYGPESEEQGWTDYPDEAARDDIARLRDHAVDAHMFESSSELTVDVQQNDIDVDVPQFQN